MFAVYPPLSKEVLDYEYKSAAISKEFPVVKVMF
jgi:hypothetical protein